MSPVETNKDVIRRWVDATNEGELDRFDDLFSATTIDHVGNQRGVAWWKEIFRRLYASFPDYHAEIDYLVAENDLVVVRLTVRATHQGSELPMLNGIAPTGREIVWTHHHGFRLDDSRITEHWANRDDLGLLRQLR